VTVGESGTDYTTNEMEITMRNKSNLEQTELAKMNKTDITFEQAVK
jgi:hypothetical protein